MSLQPGTRLGAFEVISAIGVGGMGEVYRARDTKLQRDVALKLLPEIVAADPDRLARFEREAVTLAALNHPHIAQIYGTVESDARAALVMELVDGEDLAARLTRGPMPVEEALAVARQVAEALDAAHATGIVHRDLKPANVKRRPDGVVKVLDFGLAKLGATGATGAMGATGAVRGAAGAVHATAADDLLNSPTMTSPAALTMGGMILGTAAYMSPEQARGRTVDKRTDIWAFGCLLFELLTGRPAFEGETVTDVLGSIVKSEPDWTRLPADTPPAVQRLLRRCLQKDATRRLRDIGDAVIELEAAEVEPLPATAASDGGVHQGKPPRRARLAAAWALSVVAVGALAAAAAYLARPAPEARVQKFHLAIQQDGGVIREPVISPDGRHVAYVGRSRIWVQSIDQWAPRELAATDASVRPFWSPDGTWLAYFRSEALLKVPVAGGPVVRIATLPAVQAQLGAASGVWQADGTIVISLAGGLPPMRVPSGGGEVTPLDRVLIEGVRDLRALDRLPGGAIVAVLRRSGGLDALGVFDGNNPVQVILEVSDVGAPAYSSSGHLVYARQAPSAGLWAVPFDSDRLEVTGEPFLIGEGVEPTVAVDGTLSFLGQPEELARRLAWFTLNGQIGATVADPRDWTEGVAISPDSRRMLAAANDGIWAYDIETGARSRVTTGGSDIMPAWVGTDAIVFVRTDDSEPVLVHKQLTGGREERILARRARFPYLSEDKKRLSFNISDGPGTPWQVGWMDLDREPPEIKRLAGVHNGARFPSISPDGRLVAYISGEVGRDEVFLTTLPDGEGKWQISTEGGGWTRITPRGDAVVYRALDGAFMSAALAVTGGDIKIGQPVKLFDWGAGWLPFYDLAPDGRRGITAVPMGQTTFVASLSIVQNWHREFTRP